MTVVTGFDGVVCRAVPWSGVVQLREGEVSPTF